MSRFLLPVYVLLISVISSAQSSIPPRQIDTHNPKPYTGVYQTRSGGYISIGVMRTTELFDIDEDPAPIALKYYPNPTTGILNIETKNIQGELFICDVSGKIMQKCAASGSGITIVNVSTLPSGTYFIRYSYAQQKWANEKFILVH